MQVRKLILTASAFVISSAGPAYAQDSAPGAGDSGLQSLVAEALAGTPTVAQRQAAVRAATLRIRPAGSLPDPMLTVGVMDLLLPHFEFNQSDFTEVDVELSQEIPWPGSLGARAGVVRAAAAGARAEEGALRRELTTATAGACYRPGSPVAARAALRPPPARLSGAGPLRATRSTRPPVRFRSSGWERAPTLRSRRAMATGPSRSGSTFRTSSPPSWACVCRSGRGANRTGSPMPRARIQRGPRLGCATRRSS